MDIATDCRQVTRLEIVDTGRRRRWSEEAKLRIVEESYSAPRQASATARRHGISNPLLFAWRKAHREGRLGESGVCDFVPAVIVAEQPKKGPEPAGGRWADFTRFSDDGRICLSNNAAERALRGIALGKRNWIFAGSQRGAERAAVMLTLITTARLNDVDPKAWLADVLGRIADLPTSRLHELLPWQWKRLREVEPEDQQAA
ncbi:hypothetical protein EB815_32235 [Mesorhizobium loti]|nr:hypothetical protein EB815_32235 [Mesorhizobium loti]